MTALLEVEEMSTGYAGVPVVRDLNLHVDEGEVVALLGPNGAGKTTTLLTTSALVPILAGDVKVFGRSVKGRRPHLVARDGLAHVPEDRSLFFGLTVRENLRLGAAKGSADIDQALDYFPALKPILSRRAGLLSGGEQQMLAMGRALTVRPRLLMVDEMSLGLAPIIVERLLPVLRTIADQTGAGVLVVEQHVHLALEVADRAYVLSHGNLALEGSAAELSENRHLLESSYMGQSEIAAAEEEQEEIEQGLEAPAPSGGRGRLRRRRPRPRRPPDGRLSGRYLAGRSGLVPREDVRAARRASGRRPSETARSHPRRCSMSVTEEMKAGAAMPPVLGWADAGPDDDALASAWRLDDLAATLDRAVVRVMVDSIRPAEREQAERIAAARGYSMSVEAGSDPEWLSVTFTRTSEDD